MIDIMKKTLNVDIGSTAFTLDEDAYYTLNSYYDDIRSRLYDSDVQEVMDDVESRTADIFRESLSFPSQVVGIDLVRRAIAIIGSAQNFGEKRYEPDSRDDDSKGGVKKKLSRSRSDKMIGGVCGGMADYFDIDPTIVRLLMCLLLIPGGLGLAAYVVMWIVIPLEPGSGGHAADRDKANKRRGRR